jgi:hypothetical protein
VTIKKLSHAIFFLVSFFAIYFRTILFPFRKFSHNSEKVASLLISIQLRESRSSLDCPISARISLEENWKASFVPRESKKG